MWSYPFLLMIKFFVLIDLNLVLGGTRSWARRFSIKKVFSSLASSGPSSPRDFTEIIKTPVIF